MKNQSSTWSKEFKHFLIAVILLTIVFAFNDNKSTFIASQWFSNFFTVFLLVILTVLVNMLGYKLAAKHFKTNATIRIWNYKKFEEMGKWIYPKKLLSGLLTTPFLPFLVTLFSNGRIFLSTVYTFKLTKRKVIGKRFPYIKENEIAQIAVFGLLFNIILLLIFKALDIQQGVSINSWFIFWNLIPYSELPGAKIYFGSRVLYLFSLVFFLLTLFLVPVLSATASIIIAIIFALIFVIFYLYHFYLKKV